MDVVSGWVTCSVCSCSVYVDQASEPFQGTKVHRNTGTQVHCTHRLEPSATVQTTDCVLHSVCGCVGRVQTDYVTEVDVLLSTTTVNLTCPPSTRTVNKQTRNQCMLYMSANSTHECTRACMHVLRALDIKHKLVQMRE